MKVLLVFRGDYNLVTDPTFVCNNIQKYITEPMKENNIGVDIIFCTYKSNLDKLKIYELSLKPNKIYFTSNGQIINFKESLTLVKDMHCLYDYVIFLRFDAIYKTDINKWNIFNREGVTLPFKEDSEGLFNSHGFYSDIIIIIHKLSFLDVVNSVTHAGLDMFPCNTLHAIGTIIKKQYSDIKINTILDGYYQSNTQYPSDDIRLSPLHILVKHPYSGSDKHLFFP